MSKEHLMKMAHQLTRAIRQKTCLIAVGSDFEGLCVSAAARPTSSVPEKEKDAVTRMLQKPLKPLWKAPGLSQYLPPI